MLANSSSGLLSCCAVLSLVEMVVRCDGLRVHWGVQEDEPSQEDIGAEAAAVRPTPPPPRE